MHREYARAWLAKLEGVKFDPDGVPLDPHAATVSAHAAPRPRMSDRHMRRVYRWRDHTDVTAGPTP
jgi:hypothetical protein